MTDYGKRKCELLEQKGFKANDLVFWINEETEEKRTYGFTEKVEGAIVRFITISLVDDIMLMNKLYGEIKRIMKEIKTYHHEDLDQDDEIMCDQGDYDSYFNWISDKATEIRDLNFRVHLIDGEETWDEVRGIFDCEDYADSTDWRFIG